MSNLMTETEIRPRHSGSKRLFKNPVLEKLSHTHIAIPLTLYALIGTGLLVYAYRNAQLPTHLIMTLFFSGMFIFTFVEYWLHRELYHMATGSVWRQKMQYFMHGVHHEFPKDKSRLAMPPIAAVLLSSVLLGIFYLLMSKYAYAFFPGFLWGYAGYLLIHYLTHAYPPPRNFFKVLWINHALHHYKDGKLVFGVSSPLWDYVFGTMPKK
jgi:sterol desaturase/sphingolipid hydroxylase (fatty acid hydroxylase superfamily)